MGAKLYNFRTGKFVEPLAVVADFGFVFVENFENLVQIGFRVRIHFFAGKRRTRFRAARGIADRKSTRLNSSHLVISYAVFCLKKKKLTVNTRRELACP